MKSFAIYDAQLERTEPIGYLFYYEKAECFIIELCKDLNEWEAPLLFQGLVSKGRYTVSKDISFMWVQERIIPSSRQNIGEILKTHKLKEYSEIAMLTLSKGYSAQDECYIKEIVREEIPCEIKERWLGNIVECFPTESKDVVCLFQDNTAALVRLEKLEEKYKDIKYILQSRDLLESVQVGAGGYYISFNESIEIEALDAREAGELLPLKASDFYGFVQKNIVDTTNACFIIDCSRQNLSYLVKEKKLTPILQGTKENLYTKGEISRIKSE